MTAGEPPASPFGSALRNGAALQELAGELRRAQARFGPYASPHEGWAVIREELDELWDHVIHDSGRSLAARGEALQVAATALRYVSDLCPLPPGRTGLRCDTHDLPDCPTCKAWAT